MIAHKEVIAEMRKYDIFSIGWRTYNKKTKKGGVFKELHSARLATKSVKKSTANHFQNHTFDVEVMVNGQPTGDLVRIHLPLVLFFNGESCTP